MENSFAMEILREQKLANKRLFVSLITVLTMWFVTVCYLVYILNDISTITNEQEITDIDTIENSNIINGGE